MTNDMREALKPCPFCGEKAELLCGVPGCWFVKCTGCHASSDDVSEERTIKLWNRRAALSAPAVHPVRDESTWRLDTFYGDAPQPPASPTVPVEELGRWDSRYRPLQAGEIIQAGDECLTDSHLGWRPETRCIGEPAPDPSYTSHRMYRRLLAPTTEAVATEAGQEPKGCPTAAAPAVKVKPLAWVKPPLSDTMRKAETGVCTYRTWTHHEAEGRWFWSLDVGGSIASGDGVTEEEVRSAAQTDYESRIRSALLPVPVSGEPVAWVIPGDDSAREDGSIDAMAWQEGEFSKPLYAGPSDAMKCDPDACKAHIDVFMEKASNAYAKGAERIANALLDEADKIEHGILTPVDAAAVIRNMVEHATLCSHFDDGDGDEDEHGWRPAAVDGYEQTIQAIRNHYSTALTALRSREGGA